MHILIEIQKHYLTFSTKEKEIADFILIHGETIANMKITDLAKKIGVSEGTITRFCKKIGCPSYADFKLHLNAMVPIQAQMNENDPLSYVYDFYREVIERTNNLMNHDTLNEIVNAIKQAKCIYIFGIGSAGLTAIEFMYRLMRMGFTVQSITDSHEMIIKSSVVSDQDLVIALSASGQTSEIVKATKIASQNKARVICITSFKESPLAKVAQSTFIVPNSSLIDKDQFFSQFPFVYLIDLITTVFMIDENLRQTISMTIDTIIDHTRIDIPRP